MDYEESPKRKEGSSTSSTRASEGSMANNRLEGKLKNIEYVTDEKGESVAVIPAEQINKDALKQSMQGSIEKNYPTPNGTNSSFNFPLNSNSSSASSSTFTSTIRFEDFDEDGKMPTRHTQTPETLDADVYEEVHETTMDVENHECASSYEESTHLTTSCSLPFDSVHSSNFYDIASLSKGNSMSSHSLCSIASSAYTASAYNASQRGVTPINLGLINSAYSIIESKLASYRKRAKDLEKEASKVPLLEIQMSVLKEENRVLLCQLESHRNMTEVRSIGVGDYYLNSLSDDDREPNDNKHVNNGWKMINNFHERKGQNKSSLLDKNTHHLLSSKIYSSISGKDSLEQRSEKPSKFLFPMSKGDDFKNNEVSESCLANKGERGKCSIYTSLLEEDLNCVNGKACKDYLDKSINSFLKDLSMNDECPVSSKACKTCGVNGNVLSRKEDLDDHDMEEKRARSVRSLVTTSTQTSEDNLNLLQSVDHKVKKLLTIIEERHPDSPIFDQLGQIGEYPKPHDSNISLNSSAHSSICEQEFEKLQTIRQDFEHLLNMHSSEIHREVGSRNIARYTLHDGICESVAVQTEDMPRIQKLHFPKSPAVRECHDKETETDFNSEVFTILESSDEASECLTRLSDNLQVEEDYVTFAKKDYLRRKDVPLFPEVELDHKKCLRSVVCYGTPAVPPFATQNEMESHTVKLCQSCNFNMQDIMAKSTETSILVLQGPDDFAYYNPDQVEWKKETEEHMFIPFGSSNSEVFSLSSNDFTQKVIQPLDVNSRPDDNYHDCIPTERFSLYSSSRESESTGVFAGSLSSENSQAESSCALRDSERCIPCVFGSNQGCISDHVTQNKLNDTSLKNAMKRRWRSKIPVFERTKKNGAGDRKNEDTTMTVNASDTPAITEDNELISEKMKEYLTKINQYLKGPKDEMAENMNEAVTKIQEHWFGITRSETSGELPVRRFLAELEQYSKELVQWVINLTDVNENMALHFALGNSKLRVAAELLQTELCNLNKVNKAGYSCVMLTSVARPQNEMEVELIRNILQSGDVNWISTKGQTALMLAVSQGNDQIVRLLLEAGADINLQDNEGSTALMCAAEHGFINIAKRLLERPTCNTFLKDNDGSNACEIAMSAGNTDVAVLIYLVSQECRHSSTSPSMCPNLQKWPNRCINKSTLNPSRSPLKRKFNASA